MCLQAREEVISAKQEIDRLSAALASAEQSAAEAQGLRDEVKSLQKQHIIALHALKSEVSSLQASFSATEQERDQLLQEVLNTTCTLARMHGAPKV